MVMNGRSALASLKEKTVLGPQDLWIALALGVFFFGAKKLPELSRSLGQAMSEFKKGVATGAQDEQAPPAPAATSDATADGRETSADPNRSSQ
jgi:TatA/E family protein of Tat protein translocase